MHSRKGSNGIHSGKAVRSPAKLRKKHPKFTSLSIPSTSNDLLPIDALHVSAKGRIHSRHAQLTSELNALRTNHALSKLSMINSSPFFSTTSPFTLRSPVSVPFASMALMRPKGPNMIQNNHDANIIEDFHQKTASFRDDANDSNLRHHNNGARVNNQKYHQSKNFTHAVKQLTRKNNDIDHSESSYNKNHMHNQGTRTLSSAQVDSRFNQQKKKMMNNHKSLEFDDFSDFSTTQTVHAARKQHFQQNKDQYRQGTREKGKMHNNDGKDAQFASYSLNSANNNDHFNKSNNHNQGSTQTTSSHHPKSKYGKHAANDMTDKSSPASSALPKAPRKLTKREQENEKIKALQRQINAFLQGSCKQRVSSGTFKSVQDVLKTINVRSMDDIENHNDLTHVKLQPFVITWNKLGLEPYVYTKLSHHPLQKQLLHNYARSRVQYEQKRINFLQDYLLDLLEKKMLTTAESQDVPGQSNIGIDHNDAVLSKHNTKEILTELKITLDNYHQVIQTLLNMTTPSSAHDNILNMDVLVDETITNGDSVVKHILSVFKKVQKYLDQHNAAHHDDAGEDDSYHLEGNFDDETLYKRLGLLDQGDAEIDTLIKQHILKKNKKLHILPTTPHNLPQIPALTDKQLESLLPPVDQLPSALQIALLPHMLPYKHKDKDYVTVSPMSLHSFLHLKHKFESDSRELVIKVADYDDNFLDTYELHNSKSISIEYLPPVAPNVSDIKRVDNFDFPTTDVPNHGEGNVHQYYKSPSLTTQPPTINAFHPMVNTNNYRRLTPTIPNHTYDVLFQHYDQNERLMAYLPAIIQSITKGPGSHAEYNTGIKSIILQPNREACVYTYNHLNVLLNGINNAHTQEQITQGNKGHYNYNAMRCSGNISDLTISRLKSSPPDVLITTPAALMKIITQSDLVFRGTAQHAYDETRFTRRVTRRQAKKLEDEKDLFDFIEHNSPDGELDLTDLTRLVIDKGNVVALRRLQNLGITFDVKAKKIRKMTPQERSRVELFNRINPQAADEADEALILGIESLKKADLLDTRNVLRDLKDRQLHLDTFDGSNEIIQGFDEDAGVIDNDDLEDDEEFEVSGHHNENEKALVNKLDTATATTMKKRHKNKKDPNALDSEINDEDFMKEMIKRDLGANKDDVYLVGDIADTYASLNLKQREQYMESTYAQNVDANLKKIAQMVQDQQTDAAAVENDVDIDNGEEDIDYERDDEYYNGSKLPMHAFDPIAHNSLYKPRHAIDPKLTIALHEQQRLYGEKTGGEDNDLYDDGLDASMYRLFETPDERHILRKLYSLKNCSGSRRPMLFNLQWLVMDNAELLLSKHYPDLRKILLHARNVRRLQGKYQSHDIARIAMGCGVVNTGALALSATALRDTMFVNGCYLQEHEDGSNDFSTVDDTSESDRSQTGKKKNPLKQRLSEDLDDIDDAVDNNSEDDEISIETRAISAIQSHLVSNIDHSSYSIKELLQFSTDRLLTNRQLYHRSLIAKASVLSPTLLEQHGTHLDNSENDDDNDNDDDHNTKKGKKGKKSESREDHPVVGESELDAMFDFKSKAKKVREQLKQQRQEVKDRYAEERKQIEQIENSTDLHPIVEDDDVVKLKNSGMHFGVGSKKEDSIAGIGKYQEPSLDYTSLTPSEWSTHLTNAINTVHLLQQGTIMSPLITHTFLIVGIPNRLKHLAVTIKNGNALKLYNNTDFQIAKEMKQSKLIGFERIKQEFEYKQYQEQTRRDVNELAALQQSGANNGEIDTTVPPTSHHEVIIDKGENQHPQHANDKIDNDNPLKHLSRHERLQLKKETEQYNQLVRLQQEQKFNIMSKEIIGSETKSMVIVDEYELITFLAKKYHIQLDSIAQRQQANASTPSIATIPGYIALKNEQYQYREKMLRTFLQIEKDYHTQMTKLNKQRRTRKIHELVYESEAREITSHYKHEFNAKMEGMSIQQVLDMVSVHRRDIIMRQVQQIQQKEIKAVKQMKKRAQAAVGDEHGNIEVKTDDLLKSITPTQILVQYILSLHHHEFKTGKYKTRHYSYKKNKSQVSNETSFVKNPKITASIQRLADMGISVSVPTDLYTFRVSQHPLIKSMIERDAKRHLQSKKDASQEKKQTRKNKGDKKITNVTETAGVETKDFDDVNDENAESFDTLSSPNSQIDHEPSPYDNNPELRVPDHLVELDGKNAINTSTGIVQYTPKFSNLGDLEMTSEYLAIQTNTCARIFSSLKPRNMIVVVPPNTPFEALAMLFTMKHFKPGILHPNQSKDSKKMVETAFADKQKINVLLCTDHAVQGMSSIKADVVVSWGVTSPQQYVSRSQMISPTVAGVHLVINENNTGVGSADYMFQNKEQEAYLKQLKTSPAQPDEELSIQDADVVGTAEISQQTTQKPPEDGKQKLHVPENCHYLQHSFSLPKKINHLFEEISDVLNIQFQRSFIINNQLHPTVEENDITYKKPVKENHAHHYWNKYQKDTLEDDDEDDGLQSPGDVVYKNVVAKEFAYSPVPIKVTRLNRDSKLLPSLQKLLQNEDLKEAIVHEKAQFEQFKQEIVESMSKKERNLYYSLSEAEKNDYVYERVLEQHIQHEKEQIIARQEKEKSAAATTEHESKTIKKTQIKRHGMLFGNKTRTSAIFEEIKQQIAGAADENNKNDDDDDDDDNDDAKNATSNDDQEFTGITRFRLSSIYNQDRDSLRNQLLHKHSSLLNNSDEAEDSGNSADFELLVEDIPLKKKVKSPEELEEEALLHRLTQDNISQLDLIFKQDDIHTMTDLPEPEQENASLKNKPLAKTHIHNPDLNAIDSEDVVDDEGNSLFIAKNVKLISKDYPQIKDGEDEPDVDFEFSFDEEDMEQYMKYARKHINCGAESNKNRILNKRAKDLDSDEFDELLASSDESEENDERFIKLTSSYQNNRLSQPQPTQPINSTRDKDDQDDIPTYARQSYNPSADKRLQQQQQSSYAMNAIKYMGDSKRFMESSQDVNHHRQKKPYQSKPKFRK